MTVMHYYQGSEYRTVTTGIKLLNSSSTADVQIVGTLPINQRVIFSISSDNPNNLIIKTPQTIYNNVASYIGGNGGSTTRFPEVSREVHFATDYGGSLTIRAVSANTWNIYVSYAIIERI